MSSTRANVEATKRRISKYVRYKEGAEMAQSRKDSRGLVLRKSECYNANLKRYSYNYTDPLGNRKFIYSKDLAVL